MTPYLKPTISILGIYPQENLNNYTKSKNKIFKKNCIKMCIESLFIIAPN